MFEPEVLFLGIAVLLLGVAKGGFGGVGAPVALPIMALAVSPALALGALLPILIAMDLVSVGAHRKNADIPAVLYALPAAGVGVLIGAALIVLVSPALIGGAIGVLAITFAIMALTGYAPRIDGWPRWTNGVFGGLSGLTSTLAHAGGPPIHIYFLSRGYAQHQFVATSALFMAGVNLIKVVPFVVVGTLDREAALLSLYLLPLALASAYVGVLVSRRMSKAVFKIAVNGLMIVVGLKLIFDAFT
ncbi:sulfite exporter TauE/SafE family protein [Tateyamaria sp. SN6-1]|uniref:sulfite exporter TauE/SafE family protein n=1 Tax=Tateyamaria sp. SN6-1 TaxID=3092148 RepID=UPI0039F613D9